MRRFVILSIFLILPIYGFCDRFLVSDQYTINKDIQRIESEGGKVYDVRTTRLSDAIASYTIVYKTGADIKREIDALSINR